MLLALCACAHGLVQELSSPYALDETGFFEHTNDMFMGRDDFMTASFRLRHESTRWFAACDYAILTDKKRGARTDQLVPMLGACLHAGPIAARVGGGCVLDGDFKGQVVQNTFHARIGDKPVYEAYPQRREEALGVIDVSARFDCYEPRVFAAATHGTWQATPSFRFGSEMGCVGLGWAFFGHDQSAVSERTADSMRGFELTVGGSLGYVGVAFIHSGRTTLFALASTW